MMKLQGKDKGCFSDRQVLPYNRVQSVCPEDLIYQVMLFKRWRQALRCRFTGSDSKPPQAAVVKSHGRKR